jgi:hypothetical protein
VIKYDDFAKKFFRRFSDLKLIKILTGKLSNQISGDIFSEIFPPFIKVVKI